MIGVMRIKVSMVYRENKKNVQQNQSTNSPNQNGIEMAKNVKKLPKMASAQTFCRRKSSIYF